MQLQEDAMERHHSYIGPPDVIGLMRARPGVTGSKCTAAYSAAYRRRSAYHARVTSASQNAFFGESWRFVRFIQLYLFDDDWRRKYAAIAFLKQRQVLSLAASPA